MRSSGKDTSAELFISEQLKTLLKNAKKSSELYGSSVLAYALSEGNPLLVELIGIYHDNQQWNDILTIVNNYKYWNSGNLNTIYTLKDSTKTYLGYYVATALHHNNQTDIAKDILRSLIWNDGGYDKAYQLYTDIESSENATKFLQQIYAKDQFEERPLIWQAHIKLKENDLDEAKALIKTAISIDPSDGEQGVNDRMRAYAILSEILKQQNMLDEAKLYANVVESIRTSEKADKHTNLGLLKAGIAMYEEASEQFADAYCVQSRLAIQLTKSGQYDQAQQHYRKAYELMPDSFGRVESHCFGCENIFSDARAQSIADSVFSEMVIETPDKPQVHYMLGYLREEQDDYVSALKSYRKAVALDPQYLNAWKKIFNLNKKTHIESWEINNSALKLIALDPGFEHISLDIGVISDLKGLWQTYYDAQSLLEKKPDFTYTLDASSQHLEFSETENNAISDFYRSYNSSSGDKTKYIENPSVSLLETNIIKSLLYINREEQNEGW